MNVDKIKSYYFYDTAADHAYSADTHKLGGYYALGQAWTSVTQACQPQIAARE